MASQEGLEKEDNAKIVADDELAENAEIKSGIEEMQLEEEQEWKESEAAASESACDDLDTLESKTDHTEQEESLEKEDLAKIAAEDIEEKQERLMKALSVFDKNKNGLASVEELTQVLTKIGNNRLEKCDVEFIMNSVPAENGLVSIEKLVDMIILGTTSS